MTQLPNTIPELRKLIEKAQAEIDKINSRVVPAEAVEAFRREAHASSSLEYVERGLRAAYPHLRAAWEDDGWLPAEGTMPVSGETLVVVRFRAGGEHPTPRRADYWNWSDEGLPADIVAYRISQGDK